MSIGEPEIVELEERQAIAVRLRPAWDGLDIGALFGLHMGRVMDIAGPRGETGTPYARYYQFGPEGVDMEIGVVLGPPVDEPEPVLAPADGHLGTKVGSAVLPGGRAARVLHFGAYDTLKDAYDTLMAWIPTHGEEPGVGPWELYLNMPGPNVSEADLRTEVVWPIR